MGTYTKHKVHADETKPTKFISFFFFGFTGAVFHFIILFVLLVRVFNLVFMKCLYLIFTHALGAIDNFYNNLSQLSMCIYTKIVQSTLCRSCFRNMKTSYVTAHVPMCLYKNVYPFPPFGSSWIRSLKFGV